MTNRSSKRSSPITSSSAKTAAITKDEIRRIFGSSGAPGAVVR
jgi:hypothetical protein